LNHQIVRREVVYMDGRSMAIDSPKAHPSLPKKEEEQEEGF
jgi:hypothetical protein